LAAPILATLSAITGLILSGRRALEVNTVLPPARPAAAHRQPQGIRTTGKLVPQTRVDA
jgi:hypothetical protein